VVEVCNLQRSGRDVIIRTVVLETSYSTDIFDPTKKNQHA
jgi:hypothetical protein